MASTRNPLNILFIGLVCEDIIIFCNEFPKEDDKMRCSSKILRRGGNAGNSAIVLSMLSPNINISFMSSLCSKERSSFVLSDLERYSISTDLCSFSTSHDMTVSYIIVSNKTKSRTIINHPCLKPMTFDSFLDSIQSIGHQSGLLKTIEDTIRFIDGKGSNYGSPSGLSHTVLEDIDIIHVEARWLSSMGQILSFIKRNYPQIFISIEIEKERLYADDGNGGDTEYAVNDLIPFADLLFFSSQLVRGRGYAQNEDHPKQFITDIISKYGKERKRPLTVVVPWGETGSFGIRDEDNAEIEFSKAIAPPNGVVDTIGAGDSYIGAYLSYAMRNNIWKYEVRKAMDFACKAAGYKVGHSGFDCMKTFR